MPYSLKITSYIFGLAATIVSSSCLLPAHAFVVNFTSLDDLDDASSGSAFPPNSIDEGNFQNDTDLFFFKEQTNLELTSALSVDANSSGTYNSDNNSTTATIASGTFVDSYYFSFDILNTSTSETSDIVRIEFSENILGIIYLRSSLDSTDAVLGRTGITYPTDPALARGVEKDPGITWDNDNVNLSAQLRVNNNNVNKIDHFRVITATDVPFNFSPGLGLLITLGIFSLIKTVSSLNS